MSRRSERPIPGYYWGDEQAPPDDADTAEHVETKTTYGVEVYENGEWRWSAVNFPDNWRHMAENHAATYTGVHVPVPVNRRVIEVTRTYYVWGLDVDGRIQATSRVAVAEAHTVISEHTYTGPADPFEDPELTG